MKKYLALTIISLMFFANGNAQITISTSLDEAINKAIEKNSSIKNKELEIEKINLQKKGVWNKYIPTVEASGLYTYYDNKLTIDAAPVTVPVVNLTLFVGKSIGTKSQRRRIFERIRKRRHHQGGNQHI